MSKLQKVLAAVLLLVVTSPAFGLIQYSQVCLNATPAGTNRVSTDVSAYTPGVAFNLGQATHASFQVIWASLTGTLDGVVTVEVSNDGVNWDTKSGATVTPVGASGTQVISLNGVVTEEFYRVRYVKNTISGGTITVLGRGK